jgi:integrase
VTRADLFADDATRRDLSFHDLRHSGITWRAVRGDEPLKVQRAAGHDVLGHLKLTHLPGRRKDRCGVRTWVAKHRQEIGDSRDLL